MTFRLDDLFVSAYKTVSPDFGPLGPVTYARTYSRPLEDGSSEVFWQSCRRVVEGTYQVQETHCKHLGLPWRADKAQRSAQEMFDRMFRMLWLPPGRGLWAMGTYIIPTKGAAALMNCGFVSTTNLANDFAEPFCWLMDMLMMGCGIGFDTRGAGQVRIQAPDVSHVVHVVPDTREGWVELIRRVLNSFVGKDTFPASVDYSEVRKLGAPLKTFGGTASGPGPLMDLVASLQQLLCRRVGDLITSVDITDICNLIGRCVVAGNIRRSSELALGSPDDIKFLGMKDPDVYPEELRGWRWASNNSVSATVGMDYSGIGWLTAKNGEPGYIWLDSARKYGRMGDERYPDPGVMGFNPCVEQPLEDRELCCLVESFPSRHESYEDYQRTLKFAYLYGKTATLIPTHDQYTNAVILRNRRIGLSQSGIVQAMEKFGRRSYFKMCDRAYNYVRHLDGIYSRWLCIPQSIKVTTVKPSGTVSLLPGVTPGVHYPHSQYYYRTIRIQRGTPLLDKLAAAGYRVEPDHYSPNTDVAYFAVSEPYFDRSKTQVSMWEQLENTAQVQEHWSDNGVSATITFSPDEAKDIPRALELYETRLKAVSFLPVEDHGYVQAPYQTIDEAEYNRYTATLSPLDWGQAHDQVDKYCDGEACTVDFNQPTVQGVVL